MEIITAIFKIMIFVLYVTFYFCVARNQVTFSIKQYFLDEPGMYPNSYNALPSYYAMIFHPRYQLLWTKAQWVAWVKAQGVAK